MSASDHDVTDLRDQSAGELIKLLSADISTLFRKELELAKVEVTEKGKKAGAGIGMFGAAGLVGMVAFQALTACLILVLAIPLPAWAAALIVGVVYAGIAAFLGLRGRDRVKDASPPVPEQTVETLKEDVQWLKNPRGSDKR